MLPKIGITLDWQEKGTFSARPHYALREHYFQAIHEAGGLPVGIPYIKNGVKDYIASIDGLVIPGGFFASPESWYVADDGASPYEPSPRLQFDLDIIKAALDMDKPLLGICAGMQLLGGVLGCKMTHNLHEYYDTDIDHMNEKPAEEEAHSVAVTPDSELATIVSCSEFKVNTAHNEAIVEVADGVLVSAVAPDGVIEGIEIPGRKFAIGVQWHPEFFIQQGNPSFKLFQELVRKAGENV